MRYITVALLVVLGVVDPEGRVPAVSPQVVVLRALDRLAERVELPVQRREDLVSVFRQQGQDERGSHRSHLMCLDPAIPVTAGLL